MRTGSSCPWGAVNWRIMLASLIGWHCATASGPWRCASGPPVSAGPGSGVRPPPSHRGWSSSSPVCLHCVLCTCLCQRIGSGGGGDQHGVEDPGVIAFGGGGSGNGGGLFLKSRATIVILRGMARGQGDKGWMYPTRIETGITTPAYMGATWTMPLVYVTAHRT